MGCPGLKRGNAREGGARAREGAREEGNRPKDDGRFFAPPRRAGPAAPGGGLRRAAGGVGGSARACVSLVVPEQFEICAYIIQWIYGSVVVLVDAYSILAYIEEPPACRFLWLPFLWLWPGRRAWGSQRRARTDLA